MTMQQERRYILIEAPGYIGQRASPVADHDVVHVDFGRGTIEIGIGGTKFDLRAFLHTASTIRNDLRRRAYHMDLIMPRLLPRFTSATVQEWETFKMTRADMEKSFMHKRPGPDTVPLSERPRPEGVEGG